MLYFLTCNICKWGSIHTQIESVMVFKLNMVGYCIDDMMLGL